MPLDPDVAALVEALATSGAPALSDGTVEQARANYLAAPRPEADPLPLVRDIGVPGSEGTIPVRLYSDTDGPTERPVLLFAHGGGWVLSSVDGHDHLARRLALLTGALVASVDYRLAPEHPFPAAHDDCWEVLQFLHRHATDFGGDPSRIVVCGDSAGANLVAGLAIRARDSSLPITAQVLIYPCVDDQPGSYQSMVDNATGYFLTATDMAWFWDQYVRPEDRSDPRAVPARCETLTGLPPTMLITAEYDPLRDEGEQFAHRLAAAGVPTEYICAPGVVHGFVARWHSMSRAEQVLEAIAAFVRSTGR